MATLFGDMRLDAIAGRTPHSNTFEYAICAALAHNIRNPLVSRRLRLLTESGLEWFVKRAAERARGRRGWGGKTSIQDEDRLLTCVLIEFHESFPIHELPPPD